ncbi:hypothetical protein J2P12_01385, partial [Candidatus Bathyarchaeota archaeon]|nr:hypothetical protein [Candidatus Bathyarchaeota archaeon]
YLSGIQVAKKAVTSDLQKYFSDIDTISFREVFKRTEPAPEPRETDTKETTDKPKQIEPTEEKQAHVEPKEQSAEPSRRRRAPGTRRQTAKGSQKRAMMGSESQR